MPAQVGQFLLFLDHLFQQGGQPLEFLFLRHAFQHGQGRVQAAGHFFLVAGHFLHGPGHLVRGYLAGRLFHLVQKIVQLLASGLGKQLGNLIRLVLQGLGCELAFGQLFQFLLKFLGHPGQFFLEGFLALDGRFHFLLARPVRHRVFHQLTRQAIEVGVELAAAIPHLLQFTAAFLAGLGLGGQYVGGRRQHQADHARTGSAGRAGPFVVHRFDDKFHRIPGHQIQVAGLDFEHKADPQLGHAVPGFAGSDPQRTCVSGYGEPLVRILGPDAATGPSIRVSNGSCYLSPTFGSHEKFQPGETKIIRRLHFKCDFPGKGQDPIVVGPFQPHRRDRIFGGGDLVLQGRQVVQAKIVFQIHRKDRRFIDAQGTGNPQRIHVQVQGFLGGGDQPGPSRDMVHGPGQFKDTAGGNFEPGWQSGHVT